MVSTIDGRPTPFEGPPTAGQELTFGALGAPTPFGLETFADVSGVDERLRRFRRAENELRRLGVDVSNIIGNLQAGKPSALAGDPISSAPLEGLRSDVDALRNLRGTLDDLPQQLTRAAQTGAQGAQVAALQAARQVGGGRSGLAFGGSGLVRRAAQEAATGGSANLANALVQGNLARAQFNLGASQAALSGGQALESAIFRQQFGQRAALADIQERRLAQQTAPLQQIIGGSAQVGGIFAGSKEGGGLSPQEIAAIGQTASSLSETAVNLGSQGSGGGGGGGGGFDLGDIFNFF